jgi:hypothetical protein
MMANRGNWRYSSINSEPRQVVVNFTFQPFYHLKKCPVLIGQESEWASGPVRTFWENRKYFPQPEIF